MNLYLPKDDNYPQVGNLKGITTWCEMCQEQTDHNTNWHLEREMNP